VVGIDAFVREMGFRWVLGYELHDKTPTINTPVSSGDRVVDEHV
jgi:hypothetical protein